MFNNIKAVLFDLDGTLINSAPDLALAVNATMKDLGRNEYPLDQVIQWVGNGSKILLKRALTGELDGEPEADLLENSLPHFFKHYGANLNTKSHLYDGVLETLEALQGTGIKMACVTNKPIGFTHSVLNVFDLARFFPVAVGGDSLKQLKPFPEPLLFACKELNVETCNTLMVGDSSSDMKSAKAAGMDSIAVDYGYSQGADLLGLGATTMISDFSELLGLIEL